MQINQAKEIIRKALEDNNLPDYKLTARSIDFIDLARDKKIFIFIHNWKGCEQWNILKNIAKENNFCIEAK